MGRSYVYKKALSNKTMANNIIKRSIRGFFTLISRTFFLNIISFIAFLAITSILSASEVGIFIAVIAMQRVISFFTDFGLGAALVQKKQELKQEDITTSFTIQVAITFSMFLFILLFSVWHAISGKKYFSYK